MRLIRAKKTKAISRTPRWETAVLPPGEVTITHQPCGGAKAVTRHSKEADSALCCPVSAAPDPKKCTWRGGAPDCNGHCQPGEVALESNRWGESSRSPVLVCDSYNP